MKNYNITHQRHSLYLSRDIQRKTGVSLFLYPDTDKRASQRTVSVRKKDFFHVPTEQEGGHLSPLIYEGQSFFDPVKRTKKRNFHAQTENTPSGMSL